MFSKVTFLIIGFCFFFQPGLSYRVKQEKEDLKERIIDGIPMSIESAPHHVQIIVNINNTDGNLKPAYFCGGSLITNEIVLTAAHCMEPIMKLRHVDIYAGSAKLYDYVEKRSGANILVHPYFNRNDKLDKDIAMIKVDKPFTSSKIVPIPLTMAPPKGFEQVTINGFGHDSIFNKTSSPILRHLTGTLVNCSDPNLFTRTDICVKNPVGKGACNGDSGSGLVNSKLELIGVFARMYSPCTLNQSLHNMDWYTSVYDHLNFIAAGLQRLSPNDELAKQIVKRMYVVFTKQFGYLTINQM